MPRPCTRHGQVEASLDAFVAALEAALEADSQGQGQDEDAVEAPCEEAGSQIDAPDTTVATLTCAAALGGDEGARGRARGPCRRAL